MKLFLKIFIAFLILSTLYLLRGDIMIFINDVYPNFSSNKVEDFVIKYDEKKEEVIEGKVDIPGALRVLDNLGVKKDIVLSKNKIIEITNQYRKENSDTVELKENQYLNLSAQIKLQDMFNKQYFEHISPSGVSVGGLSEGVGYQYILIGENLAMGNFDDDLALVNAWMNSEGHRINILNKNYTEIGVAVAKGMFEGKNIWMAVQHFGTPISTCPDVDQELYKTVINEQGEVKEMEEYLLKKQADLKKGIFDEGSSHYSQIENYNSLIQDYNNLIKKIKKEIIIYNEEVQSFNICLLKYQ